MSNHETHERHERGLVRADGGRRSRGRARGGVNLPVPPSHGEMPKSYGALLADLKQRIAAERVRVVMAANSAMILLYWDIGRAILRRQAAEGWGAKVIDRLSVDLREAFPDMQGLSPRNLLFMRSFAEAYPDPEIVKQLVSQLLGHACVVSPHREDLVA